MNHFLSTIIIPLIYLFFTLQVACLIGDLILRLIKIDKITSLLLRLGISILVGSGVLGYLSLVMSIFDPLNKSVILLIYFFVFLLGFNRLIYLYQQVAKSVIFIKEFNNFDKILLTIILFFIIFYVTGAFVPPYRTDALAYHLPEVVEIASGNIGFPLLSGGKFYGNIPFLMESYYSSAYVLSGFVLINLFHFLMALSLVLIIYSIIKNEFSRRAALLGILWFLAFYDFFVNATNAYVDAATVAFEISAILLIILWIKEKQRSNLILSGILYGLALSTKYIPLYSLITVVCLLLFEFVRCKIGTKEAIKNCLSFGLSILLFCGFWYIKNLIMFDNPFYPFIFGHPGYTDQEIFGSRLDFLHYTIPHNLYNFILLPFKLFTSPYFLPLFPAFFVFPIGLLLRKNVIFLRYLMLFVFSYIAVWFFLISEHKRYGYIGIILLLIIGGIVLDWLIERYRDRLSLWYFKVSFLVFLIFLIMAVAEYKGNYFFKVKELEIKYFFGLIDEIEFYKGKQLGGIYEASNYINDEFVGKKFINNWNSLNFFLENDNQYINLLNFVSKTNPSEMTWIKICSYLKSNGLDNLVIDEENKQRTINDEWWSKNRQDDNIKKMEEFESLLIKNKKQEIKFNSGYASIFQLDLRCQ